MLTFDLLEELWYVESFWTILYISLVTKFNRFEAEKVPL